jgi:16S rRNA (guanine966-N2)-methyltransferase
MSVGTRIMSGNLRGQKIGPLPKNIFARPILARIKKSLFDILRTRVPGALFLDLFSGSGTVGLEAISRGAKKVVFIDANPQCQRWIESMLRKSSESNPALFQNVRYEVHRANVLSGLSWLNEQFDLIFSGAPYKDEQKKALFFISDILIMIEKEKILKPKGWFIAQHHIKETFEVPKSFNFFRQERYGDSMLSFFEYV